MEASCVNLNTESNVIIYERHQMYQGSNIKLPTFLYYIPMFVNNQEIVQPKLISHHDLVPNQYDYFHQLNTHGRIFMLPFSIK